MSILNDAVSLNNRQRLGLAGLSGWILSVVVSSTEMEASNSLLVSRSTRRLSVEVTETGTAVDLNR